MLSQAGDFILYSATSVANYNSNKQSKEGAPQELAQMTLSNDSTNVSLQVSSTKEKTIREDEDTNKDYILQAYGYESVSDNELELDVPALLPKSSYEGGTLCDLDDECATLLSSLSLENLILELEYRLLCDEEVIQDDAAMYMMSKAEVKALKKQTQKRRQVLKRQRTKMQKAKHAQKQEIDDQDIKQQPLLVEQDSEYGLDFGFDMFADDDETANLSSNQDNGHSTLSQVTKAFPKIGKSWLGKTPRQQLQEYCRKCKLGTPKFQNSGKGCRVVVYKTTSALSIVEVMEDGPFDTCADAQHYVATVALYRLDPTMSVYLVLPPDYRDLWLEWVRRDSNIRQNELEVSQALKEKEVDDIVQRVLSAVLSSATPLSHNLRELDLNKDTDIQSIPQDDAESGIFKHDQSLYIPDEWDANNNDQVLLGTHAHVNPTTVGKRMKKDFIAVQKTKSYEAMMSFRQQLPMWRFKKQLLDTIEQNSVTILHGETGCGKTTQCAQFILEQWIMADIGDQVSVLCTQVCLLLLSIS